MYEDVLVLRLHHVVPLGPEAGHVTVHVHGLLVLDAFEHGVDHDEGAGAADAGTEEKNILNLFDTVKS